MPLDVDASCRCGSVQFVCQSHTPVPYQRCYCSICRKTAGGGGFAINIGANSKSLKVDGESSIGIFRAELKDDDGQCKLSTAERRFCTACGAALWLFSPEWPELIHPFASVVELSASEGRVPCSHDAELCSFLGAARDRRRRR